MPGDLPGPEKPLPVPRVDWLKLIDQDSGVATAAKEVYAPKRLRPRQRMVLILHEMGWTGTEIAAATGYTQSRVSVIINSRRPEVTQFRAEWASRAADRVHQVEHKIALHAEEAVDTLAFHMRRKEQSPTDSRLAARDILHMAGFSPVKRQFIANANIPPDLLHGTLGAIREAHEAIMEGNGYSVHSKREGNGDG